jgi:sortase (surface protein transpeptidase)
VSPVPPPGERPADGRAAEVGARRASGRHRRAGDPVVRWLAGAGALLVLVACGAGARAAVEPGDPTTTPAPRSEAARPTEGSWGPVDGPQSPVSAPTERSAGEVRPLSVSIPAIGVRSSLVPLRLLPGSGELAAPEDFGQAGWYVDGPTPGDPGPAVIAGHVDSRAGPAIFFRLRELRPGDVVEVRRSDGTTARFTVTGVERHPKADFPTQRVHGPTPDRALRLITCGGSFDYAKRSYRDNVVVYAVRS